MEFEVYQRGTRLFSGELPPRVLLGRQGNDDPPPCTMIHETTEQGVPIVRFVFASKSMRLISRQQLELECVGDGQVRVKHCGRPSQPDIHIRKQDPLPPGAECVLNVPCTLIFDQFEFTCLCSVEMASAEEKYDLLPMLDSSHRLGAENASQALGDSLLVATKGRALDEEAYEDLLVRLQAVVQTIQVAATSASFLNEITETTCQVAELESAAVLMREDDRWKIAAFFGEGMDPGQWKPSNTVLERVLRSDRTVYRKPPTAAGMSDSLRVVDSVVASPIRDRDERIIGVLYSQREASGRPIGRLEARLVEMLASGISAALLRVEQESKAIQAQVCLQQFVTPEIARYVQEDPALLKGREEEVSLLFCDISGFSRIAHSQQPATTVEWLNDVLQELSECILEEDGTLVDYGGDEIFAMFGAPVPQSDHAGRAHRAGLAILQAIPRINDRWANRLGAETGVGVGINSGRVLVGNVGSTVKLKYGAHGNQVNVASRVQSATRFFKVPFLATEALVQRLDVDCHRRRIGAVRVKGIDSPVQLFEMRETVSDAWQQMREDYEAALVAWEAGDVEQAVRRLSHLTANDAQDGPSQALLNKALHALNTNAPAEPVWEMLTK